MWCVAELDEEYIRRDEEYIRRMEDILAVYEKPLSEREPVVCVDEKPVVLHQEVRPPRAMRPGRVARRDGEYERCGTANVFCGVQPKAGQYFPKVTAHRSSPEFAVNRSHSQFPAFSLVVKQQCQKTDHRLARFVLRSSLCERLCGFHRCRYPLAVSLAYRRWSRRFLAVGSP